jgi:hypothetical protein
MPREKRTPHGPIPLLNIVQEIQQFINDIDGIWRDLMNELDTLHRHQESAYNSIGLAPSAHLDNAYGQLEEEYLDVMRAFDGVLNKWKMITGNRFVDEELNTIRRMKQELYEKFGICYGLNRRLRRDHGLVPRLMLQNSDLVSENGDADHRWSNALLRRNRLAREHILERDRGWQETDDD